MADNDDGEIRWRIVGPVVVQRLAASWAGVRNLEIAAEHGAFATSRAGQPRASQQRRQHGALAGRSRVAADDAGAVGDGSFLHAHSLSRFRNPAKSDYDTRPH